MLLDKFFNLFGYRTAVINENPEELKKEVEKLQKVYGPWIRIKGFSDYYDFFSEIEISCAKNRPYKMIFLSGESPDILKMVLNKCVPNIKTYNLSKNKLQNPLPRIV